MRDKHSDEEKRGWYRCYGKIGHRCLSPGRVRNVEPREEDFPVNGEKAQKSVVPGTGPSATFRVCLMIQRSASIPDGRRRSNFTRGHGPQHERSSITIPRSQGGGLKKEDHLKSFVAGINALKEWRESGDGAGSFVSNLARTAQV